MSSVQRTHDFKEDCNNYEEEICKLKKKLTRHDEIITERDELRCQLSNFKQLVENMDLKGNQMRNDLMNDLNCQSNMLIEVKESEAILQTENKGLHNQINCKTEQITTLKQKEKYLLNELEEFKKNKIQMENELCKVKGQIEEKDCTIEKLIEASKSNEEEYFDVKRQLDECQSALCRESEAFKVAETELKSMNTTLMDTKLQLTTMEEKTRLERETLCNELETTCHRMRIMQNEYIEARQIIDKEKSNVRNLENKIVNLREVNEKERCEANTQIQRLKNDNSENARRMKSQISTLTQQNECILSENSVLKTKLNGKKNLLEKMKQAIKMLEQKKQNQIDQLKRENKTLECDVQKKIKNIENLEQEMYSLRVIIKNNELKNGFRIDECEISCLKKKIKELKSKFINNNSYPPIKCGSNCYRDCEERISKNCCPSYNNKCPPAPKKCKNGYANNSHCILSDLEQMYSELEQYKDIIKV